MAPKTRKNPPRKLRQTTLLDAISPVTRSSQKTRSSGSTIQISSSPVRSKRRRATSAVLDEESADSDVGAIKFEPKPSVQKDTDEDESPPRSTRKKRRIQPVRIDSGTESAVEEGNVKDDDVFSMPRTRLSKGKGKQVHSTDSEQDALPRRRRKLVKGQRPLTPEEDDIANEVEEKRILNTRLRVRGKRTAFQKNLERLKRRKLGLSSEPSESDEDSEEESASDETPFKGAKPHSDHDSLFDEDSDATVDSSDFIVEDDGAVAAVLPMQFSMETHQDLAHHFKKIFQFFVHIAVHPPADRRKYMEKQMMHEEYFSVPLQVARRKILGLRDSLVASSVWRPDFITPLGNYPELEMVRMEFAVPTCDACHLGGRMSTLIGRLSGNFYNKLGFADQAINSDSEDSSEDSDHAPKHPRTVDFHLGRFCAKRTKVYHEHTHWEYNLFKSIRQEVDDLHAADQSRGFLRVAYSGGKQPPDDLTDADAICEWLDERKMVDIEWQRVKDMMESARHLEIASKKGGDD